jgi:hypothetical protein
VTAAQQRARDGPELVPRRRFAATRNPQLDVELLGEAGTFGEARALERAIRGAALTGATGSCRTAATDGGADTRRPPTTCAMQKRAHVNGCRSQLMKSKSSSPRGEQ